jgi:hypothetical protein
MTPPKRAGADRGDPKQPRKPRPRGPRAHKAYVYDPIDRIRRPFDPGRHDEPIVIRLTWCDDANALLVFLREVLAIHVEQIRGFGMRQDPAAQELARKFALHLRLGLRAMDIIGTLLASQPKMLVLEPTAFVDNSILLFVDAMVATLREIGPAAAGQMLQQMGWRPGNSPHAPRQNVYFTERMCVRSALTASYAPYSCEGQVRAFWIVAPAEVPRCARCGGAILLQPQTPAPPPPPPSQRRGTYYSPVTEPHRSQAWTARSPTHGSQGGFYSPTRDSPRSRPAYHSPAGRSGAGHAYESPQPRQSAKQRPAFESKRVK